MIGTIAVVQLIPVLLALAAAGGLGVLFGGCGSAVKDPNYPSDESWETSDADDVSGEENYTPEYEVEVEGQLLALVETDPRHITIHQPGETVQVGFLEDCLYVLPAQS